MQILPHSLDAEKALINNMLADNDIIFQTGLTKDDFYNLNLGKVHDLCVKIKERGKEVDFLILKDYMEANGLMEQIGGVQFFSELIQDGMYPNWVEYSSIIKEKSMRRSIIQYADQMRTTAMDESAEASDSLKAIEGVSEVLFQSNKGAGIIDLVDDFEEMRDQYNENGGMLGVSSPYPEIDEFTQGLKKGTVFTIAAFSNTGKTSVAVSYACHLLKMGKTVTFFTMDGKRSVVMANMIRCMYEKTFDEIMKPDFCFDLEDFKNLIVYDDKRKIEDIQSITTASKPDVVFIDYIQKVTASGFRSSIEENDYIAHRVQDLAVDTDCIMFTLSQVPNESRGKTTDVNLKGSGELFSAAEDIILLYKEDGFTKLLLLKTKVGAVGKKFILGGDFATLKFKLVKDCFEETGDFSMK